MAAKFLIDVKRSDMLSVKPGDLLLPEKDEQGRPFAGRDKEDAKMLAENIFDYGQQQPCVVRKIKTPEGNSLELISGFTRKDAVELCRKGFTGQDGVRRHNADLLLNVVIQECDDETSRILTYIENAQRKATSPIDDAYNQQKLREGMMPDEKTGEKGWPGKSDADIARLFRVDPATVSRNKSLLKLDKETQKLVHTGALAVSAALATLALEEPERKEVIAQASQASGKVDSTVIKKAIRNKKIEQQEAKETEQAKQTEPVLGQAPAPKAETHQSRSAKEIKSYFADVFGAVHPSMGKLTRKIVQFCEGKISDRTMTTAFKTTLEEIQGTTTTA